MNNGSKLAIALVALLASSMAHAQRTPQASLDCKPGGAKFVYDCNVRLTRAGSPLANVEVSVGADMPSMPMAHNVKPAKAKPTEVPGEFQARLELEMHGEWALKLRVSGAVNDLLVLRYEFDEKGARPAQRPTRGAAIR